MTLDINGKRHGHRWRCITLLILAAGSCIPRPTHAQTRLTGTVRDASTQLALGDVRIEVVDRRIRSVTDSTGAFVLDRVPRGTYSIRFSRIGYHFAIQQGFDFVIAVAFNRDYSIRFAFKLTHKAVSRLATYRKHVNAHLLTLSDTVVDQDGATDISAELRRDPRL